MKIKIEMIMGGKGEFLNKFRKTLEENKTIHLDIIKTIGHTMMIAFRFSKDDDVTIEHFKACEIEEVQKTEETIEI